MTFSTTNDKCDHKRDMKNCNTLPEQCNNNEELIDKGS